MSEESEHGSPVSVWRILQLARPEAGLLLIATLALLLGTSTSLLFPQAVRAMVDTIGGKPVELPVVGVLSLNEMALGLLIIFAFQAVLTMIRAWLFTIAGERVVVRLRRQLYSSIIRQEISFFDQSRIGELTNRLASDTTVLQNTVTVNVSMALRFGVTALGGMAMIVYTSPTLALISLTIVPVLALTTSIYGRLIRRWSKDVQNALAEATTVAEETFAGVRTVRAFAQEEAEIARYDEAIHTSYRLAAKRALAMGIFNGFVSFSGYGVIAVVVWYGGHQVIAGDLSSGNLAAFLLYTLMVAFSIAAGANLYADFMRATGASQRVFHLMDRANTVESSGIELPAIEGRVRFTKVSFSYPTRPDVPVLREFSLTIDPGQAVALVGPSGAGKSTVAQLLTRFYDPLAGVITLDEVDVSTVDGQSLRRQVGVVAQEPLLFATNIANNIRYGRPDASDQDVELAAKAANAHDFIEGFPDGYTTLVGERGVRLSGGQKQRIAIARAVLKDPAVLILDEATSALDADSEHLVQEALERLMKGRTTLIIAHRLSTVRNAHQVLVLSGGRVVERGSHEELIAHNGLYKKLVERQFQA